MLLYHPEISPNWPKYGILVPLRDDRSYRVFHALKKQHPELTPLDFLPEPLGQEALLLAHCQDYVDRLFDREDCKKEVISCFELLDEQGNFHRYDPSLAQGSLIEFVSDIRRQAAMSALCMQRALEEGLCYYLGGGMHHAMSDCGRGFCLINDLVIGVRLLQQQKKIKSAWIIDVDAHKGDGTAQVTQGDESIVTFSIHMKSGWPLDQGSSESPWFIPSDVDIEIESGEEYLYLESLKNAIHMMESKYQRPDLVVINQGADPYEKDELLSTQTLNLSEAQLLERDIFIDSFFSERKIPRAYLMSGGYGRESWRIYVNFLSALLAKN